MSPGPVGVVPRGIMGVVKTPNSDWVTIAAYENLRGRPGPMAATRA